MFIAAIFLGLALATYLEAARPICIYECMTDEMKELIRPDPWKFVDIVTYDLDDPVETCARPKLALGDKIQCNSGLAVQIYPPVTDDNRGEILNN